MQIHQLSLFLENKPGQLLDACKLLADAGVSIQTLTLADTQDFGILRLIVPDWQRAVALFEQAGYAVKVTPVVAVEVPDRPGGLAELLAIVDRGGVNIEYMYAFTFGRGDRAVLIFRFDRADAAIALLQRAGINVVDAIEIYKRAAK
jgi:hypothetical protein